MIRTLFRGIFAVVLLNLFASSGGASDISPEVLRISELIQNKQYKAGLDLLFSTAKKGDARAQSMLGDLYNKIASGSNLVPPEVTKLVLDRLNADAAHGDVDAPQIFGLINSKKNAPAGFGGTTVQNELPRIPDTKEGRELFDGVAREIYKIFPQNDDTFFLTVTRTKQPIFPGEGLNNFSQLECERLAAYTIYGYENAQGDIWVAVCENGAQARDLAIKAEGRLASVLKGPLENLAKAPNWQYSRSTIGEGTEFYYFPVVAVGHGIASQYTGISFDKNSNRAIVVQMDTYPMCDPNRVSRYKDAPFCADSEKALRELTLGISQQSFAQK